MEYRFRGRSPSLQETYPLAVQFYTVPEFSLNYDEVIEWVNERIAVLGVVHTIRKQMKHVTWEVKRKAVTKKLEELGIHRYVRLLNNEGHHDTEKKTKKEESDVNLHDRLVDHVSFIGLRLSLLTESRYKASEHQKLEEDLFALRIAALDDERIHQLMTAHEIFYPKWLEVTKEEENDPFFVRHTKIHADAGDISEFSKVPYNILLTFINLREIPLYKGIAYVPPSKMSVVLQAHFRIHLNELSKIFQEFLKDYIDDSCTIGRFGKLFQHANEDFQIMQNTVRRADGVSAKELDKLSKTAFPPCMRIVHEALRKNHHLKHKSRRQYFLFLKGIGMKSDETVEFFRDEFCTKGKVQIPQFNREYEYYIRHAYGEKGSRIDYEPKDCEYLMVDSVTIGDCNGCPLVNIHKPCDIEDFGKQISPEWKVPKKHVAEMVNLINDSRPNEACAEYFHAVNGWSIGPVTSPNEFYNQSIRIRDFGDWLKNAGGDKSDVEDPMEIEITNPGEVEQPLFYESDDVNCKNLVLWDEMVGCRIFKTCSLLPPPPERKS